MGLHPLATSDKSPPLSESGAHHPDGDSSPPGDPGAASDNGGPAPSGSCVPARNWPSIASKSCSAAVSDESIGLRSRWCSARRLPSRRQSPMPTALPSLRLGGPFICSPGGAVRSDDRPAPGDGDRVRRRNTAQPSRTQFLSHHSTRAADAEAAGRGSSDAPGDTRLGVRPGGRGRLSVGVSTRRQFVYLEVRSFVSHVRILLLSDLWGRRERCDREPAAGPGSRSGHRAGGSTRQGGSAARRATVIGTALGAGPWPVRLECPESGDRLVAPAGIGEQDD